MTLGSVRVMEAGMALIMLVEEVYSLKVVIYFDVLEKHSSILVLCLSLSDPNNGTINCSLGADGVPSYEDTCNFTCNTGYELTSNDTRTCQSNGSWSGSVVMCTGKVHIITICSNFM